MKSVIVLVVTAVLLTWAFQERRELMMHYMAYTSSGAPPPLNAAEDEGPLVRWLDDYFTIEMVAANTWAIGEPRYAQQNYSYLIVGSQRAILFDAGPGIRDIRSVAESLTDLPITFLPSHFHYDHVGNQVTFEDIAVPDLPHIRARQHNGQLTLTAMEHLGAVEGFNAPTWQVDHWWTPGTVIDLGARKLWLLYTPGHTTDSVSLWDPKEKLLFSGDYIYPGPLYGFLPNSNMYDYLSTAQTLLDNLPAGTQLLGAHRVAAPGAPRLAWSDLVNLDQGLRAMQSGELPGEGSYPQSFRINNNMVMLAEPRWLQEWQNPGVEDGVILNDDDAMRLRIEAQMVAADRHKFDLPRDAARKPYATFKFLGLEAGMVALDVGAYAGYTTEMLAAAVGKQGSVYSHNTEAVLLRYADGYYERTMQERLANNRLPNTKLHITPYTNFGLDSSVDVAFLGNLLHDFYYQEGRQAAITYLRAIGKALKPNGVLGLTDHVGNPQGDNAKLHRIEPMLAKQLLADAGFEVVEESDLFTNPRDDHSLMVYDERIYRQTDRFFFKARKTGDP